MKRWIFWILLLILTVGAIALAIVLLWGNGAEETQPRPSAVPSASSTELPAEERPAPEQSKQPDVTEAPLATEEPKTEHSAEGQSVPTQAPATAADTPSATEAPSATETPYSPDYDEDELPLLP